MSDSLGPPSARPSGLPHAAEDAAPPRPGGVRVYAEPLQAEPAGGPGHHPRMACLARNWWAFLLRGLLAVFFGVLALGMPGPTLFGLALLLAAYLLTDGVFALVGGVRAAARHERWGLMLLEGVAGIAAGTLALLWPGATMLVIVLLTAVWAIVTGGLQLLAARTVSHGRVWLGMSGVLSILLGILMIAVPPAGGYAVVFLVGVYAFASGVALIAWGFQLRGLHARMHGGQGRGRTVPA